jgi:signal transduction histidine kinase
VAPVVPGALAAVVDRLLELASTSRPIAVILIGKARSPSRLRRRAVGPLLFAFAILVLSVGTFVTLSQIGDSYDAVPRTIAAASALALPVGLLVEQIRGNVFAATSVGRIAAKASAEPLDAPRVESLVADALGDPTLRLAFWVPEPPGYVDVRGAPIELPDERADRAYTPVIREGRPVAALIHDPALDTDPGVVEGLAATSLMVLENIRLVEELRASRARIVAAAERERLRLERDLRDGAQQRLMAIQVKLALAQERTGEDLVEQLEAIRLDAAAAVEELRTLAHGIYPTLLLERGLADALRSVAMTAPIVIRVRDEGIGRLPAPVEAAVYFCSLEAIQNTIKHAGSGAHVTVTLARRPGGVHFEINDDGVGMETRASADGVGLVSMRDRIGAVGGELQLSSSPGHGTSVRGTVPDDGSEWAAGQSKDST